MLAFRSRPKQLELRRTSSCSSLLGRKNKVEENLTALCCINVPKEAVAAVVAPLPRVHLQPVQEGIEHISLFNQSVPMCTFCGETCAKVHNDDCTRLKIVSRGYGLWAFFKTALTNDSIVCSLGLVRSRDGGRLSPNPQPYMSLPSPNIQSAQTEHQPVHEEQEESLTPGPGPDSTQLVRRGALVPPKIDDPLNGEDEDEHSNAGSKCDISGEEQDQCCSGDSLIASTNTGQRHFPRRSSVVVIPPMQVCPGDLLVYSKALTHRGNFPGFALKH